MRFPAFTASMKSIYEMFREKTSTRRDFKSGLSAEDVRSKRTDNALTLRKQERDEQLARRRKQDDENEPSDATTMTTAELIADIGNLPQYAQGLAGPDPELIYNSAKRIRQLLSLETNPPIDATIRLNAVPRLVELLSCPDTKTAFEAAWALTNIASGTSEHTAIVVDAGAVPVFVRILDLDTPDAENLRDQAVWALGNISGECSRYRDLVLGYDAMSKLLVLAHKRLKLSMLRNIAWTLSNFCRGKEPQPNFNIVSTALPTLFTMIKFDDEDVMADACWALSYLSDDIKNDQFPENYKIEVVVESGVLPRLVQLLSYPNHHVITPALRTIGNIVTGNNQQTQMVLNQNVLPVLASLLNHSKPALRKEACWAISNISAGNLQQVRAVVHSNVFQILLNLINGATHSMKKEIAWAVSNALANHDVEITQYMVQIACIPALVDLLRETDVELQMVVLESLGYILVMIEKDKSHTIDYAKLVEESGALNVMEKMQETCDDTVFNKIKYICKTYFNYIFEDAADEPVVTEQGTFSFNPNQDNQFNF